MAPPRKGSLAGVEAKETLTAVVLADSFTQRFRPVTLERPKVLLPLVNAPLLDYTLEWLAVNAVEEVFVFCCAHAEQVEAHLASAGWLRRRKMAVRTVVATNCLSAGDALRLLDHRDVIKNDFILVSGDVVSNVRLAPALEAHRRRRAADKSALMTLVMRSGVGEAQRRRLGETGITAVMDPHTKRLLKFEEHPPSPSPSAARRRRLRLDAAAFGERDDAEVRTDLADTSICIAAPEVLMLFSDNFDYQNVRRDFVSGVLSEEELGNKLFVHEVDKEYAARVNTLRAYDAVSRDVMARWAYPLVPDTNVFGSGRGEGGATAYRYERNRIYLDESVTVSRSARLSSDCCLAAGTVVGAEARIQGSVLGRDCRVDPGAVVAGCYLGAGVRVGEGAVVVGAMLCDGVTVKEGARVERDAVLSYGVVIDAGAVVPAGSRVSLAQQAPPGAGAARSDDETEVPATGSASPNRGNFFGSSDGDSDGEGADGPHPDALAAARTLAAGGIPEVSIDFDFDVVGREGAGFLWASAEGDVGGEAALRLALAPTPALLTPEAPAFGVWDGDDSGSDNEAALAEDGAGATGAASPAASPAGGAAQPSEPLFKREVAETFLRCVKEGISQDNVVIELNGLKIAEDKTFADCARFMLTTALGLALPPPPAVPREYRSLYDAGDLDTVAKEGRAELLRRAGAQLRRWGDLLRKFLRSEDDQVEVLLTVEEFCGEEGDYEGTGERGAAYASIFPQLLKLLYDEEVVGEEAILQWADEKEEAEAEERAFLELAQPLVDWLRQAEEGSSEEEESSEEE